MAAEDKDKDKDKDQNQIPTGKPTGLGPGTGPRVAAPGQGTQAPTGQTAAPTTPNSVMPNPPVPGSSSAFRLQQEQKKAAPKPEPIKTQAEVQADLGPGQIAGKQTRRADGSRASLMDQKAPAGKELIGMRSGVPIYADASDVYGVDTEAPVVKPLNNVSFAAGAEPTLENVTKPNFFGPTTPKNSGFREATDAEKNQRLQQARAAYQTGATASAVRAQAAPAPTPAPERRMFGAETRADFNRAQAEARQRAVQRLAYPRQDRPTNTTETANAAAAALRRAAAEPKVASMEEVQRTGEALGWSPEKTKQVGFGLGVGVDDQGNPLTVTPSVLKRLRQRAGLNY